MNKKITLFGFIMLVAFTILNIMIHKHYYADRNDAKTNDTSATPSAASSSAVSSAIWTSQPEENEVISFWEYRKFYEYLSKNFKLKGYEKKYDTNHSYIMFIEKAWAFNTRDRLLLSDPDKIPRSTLEYLLYENKKSTCQITIVVCFNEHYIGNNLHSLLSYNSDLRNINHELSKNSTGAVMSYKNILFHIHVSHTQKENYDIDNVLTELSARTSRYFKK